MTRDKKSTERSFNYIVILTVEFIVQSFGESEFTLDLSKRGLTRVPRDLPLQIEVLDVSQNNISELQLSDMKLFSRLKVLKFSHNKIQHLDFNVFKFNQDLEYLDLSHNQLKTLSCYAIQSLKHLDLSFNGFDVLPVCKEYGNLTQLDFLGLSASKLQQLDLLPVAHLQLGTILLDLHSYSMNGNEPGSLHILNTKALHLVFHPTNLFSVPVNIYVNNVKCLQLTNIKLTDKCPVFMNFLSDLIRGPNLVNLTLEHVETTWKCLAEIFQSLWPKSVEYLNIYSLTVVKEIELGEFTYPKTALKGVKIEHVKNRVFIFTQTALYKVFSKMNIMMLTISDTPFIHMLCPQSPSTFKVLNFTQNVFTDSIFENCSTLDRLETLILQNNKLGDLYKVSLMTKGMHSLETLDVSWNSLDNNRNAEVCTWAQSIVMLNLSSNVLTDSVFRCLPPRVKVLDLHSNRIRSIPKDVNSLEALQVLNVASNSLTQLPGCGAFSRLSALIIDYNLISSPSPDFFQSCQHMRSIKAGNNPFQCTCELREFVQRLGQVSHQVVEDWPGSYQCDYPESYKGTALQDFHMSPLSCNTALLIVTIVLTVLVLGVSMAVLCICFDVPWYVRMMCQWTRTRHRARNIPLAELQRNLHFHAFISYSEHDSVWVKNELVPCLEKENIRICLHERNFVPGKSIVENIISCIERSYKSIFVLSPSFVQSEWCHYELYFAHHNLFHEGSDNLILILLEPIPQNHIPTKYHKLKALMTLRTYLEWPKEKSKRGLFWANIIAAFHTKLTLVNENDAET